jgi:hypothetical protein
VAVNENGNLTPNGLSLSWTPTVPRVGMLGVGGTYYWNPGSPTAPPGGLPGLILDYLRNNRDGGASR